MTIVERAEMTAAIGQRVKVLYRKETNDWNTLFSCLVYDEYQIRQTPPGTMAVDVGGHCGGATLALLAHGYSKVLTIEPLPENVDLIKEQLHINDWTNRCEVVQGAVSSSSAMVKVCYGDVSTESGAHHEFVGNQEGADGSRFVMAAGITLEDILDWTGEIDLLKLDCEGGEWELFKNAQLWQLDLIKLIVAELHGPNSTADLITSFHLMTHERFHPDASPQIHEAGLAAVRMVHK